MKEIWHRHNHRVFYKETDRMGVVHHANYVSWFEIGRTECMRALGLPYSWVEDSGFLLPVMKLEVNYKKPAVYDDSIAIYTKVKAYSAVRLDFYYEIRRIEENTYNKALEPDGFSEPEGELLISGITSHMWINKDWKPVRINHGAPEFYEILQKYYPEEGK